jgi:Glycosyltransferase 61
LIDALQLGGKNVSLPRGALCVSGPRELLVARSYIAAFETDGTVARDTVCYRDEAPVLPRLNLPARLDPEQVVQVHDEEVAWGGNVAVHFGHFMVDSVGRLWPLLPGAELHGLPVVLTTPQPAPYVQDWLRAFGVRVVELPEDGAVRFTRVRVPEQAWRAGAWIAPEFRDIHLGARRGLEVPKRDGRDVLWLSRAGLDRRRTAYDEALLEWLLRDRVESVRPETMTLAEQVAAFECCRVAVGVAGSAFHGVTMAFDPPDCLYLRPPWAGGAHAAQHRFLGGEAVFAHAMEAVWTPPARRRGIYFPFGYRMLIPETLLALRATALPDLFEDTRLRALARDPSRGARAGNGLDSAVARVVSNPLSFEARMKLGAAFEREGLVGCAREQFSMVADLTDDPGLSEAARYASAGSPPS